MPISKPALILFCACILSPEIYAQQPGDGSIGEVFATDASVTGSVLLAAGGTRVASGSSVAAGRSPASLRLQRGGEVLVCRGTSVSVTASARSKGLMLSLDSGTIETHYSVSSSADTIQTPDFRILLPGPGDFNFAISADKKGNACVRALEGNSASIVVAEMMGDGSYQVRPNDMVTFSDGKVSNAVPFGRCGCAAAPQTLKVEVPKPAAVNNAAVAPPPLIASVSEKVPQPPTPDPAAPTPASKPDDVHVQVDVPLVYSADAPANPAPATAAPAISPQPEPVYLPAAVYLALFRPVLDVPVVTPTPPPAKT